jgi:glycosyltransferase involved in cell wall biosynthesis
VRAAIDVLGPGDPDDVPTRYRESTVTLLPAEHEAFGLALVESLACGTPVACTPTGGMPEIIGDEPVGMVARESTPLALAEALHGAISLSAEPSTPALCAARARYWSWKESVGPAHERLYRAISRRSSSTASEREGDTEGPTLGSVATT